MIDRFESINIISTQIECELFNVELDLIACHFSYMVRKCISIYRLFACHPIMLK
ncbi:MAG: hypothetical protein ACFWUG_03075 [Rahnella inusitata]